MSLQEIFSYFNLVPLQSFRFPPVTIEHGTMKETEFSCPFFYFIFHFYFLRGGGALSRKRAIKKSERATCILGYIAEYPSHDLILCE